MWSQEGKLRFLDERNLRKVKTSQNVLAEFPVDATVGVETSLYSYSYRCQDPPPSTSYK